MTALHSTQTASRNLRRRNLAVGVCVAFLAALCYALAIAKLGAHGLLPPQ